MTKTGRTVACDICRCRGALVISPCLVGRCVHTACALNVQIIVDKATVLEACRHQDDEPATRRATVPIQHGIICHHGIVWFLFECFVKLLDLHAQCE